MKKEEDFTLQHRQELLELNHIGISSPTDQDLENLKLMMEAIEEADSQFLKIINVEKWKKIENVFYPNLRDIAKKQCGYVSLEINEKKFVARLFYKGDTLMLNNTNYKSFSIFSAIVSEADDIFICKADSYFELQFIFLLYEKVQIKDHSGKIKKIKKEMLRNLTL